MVKVDINAGLGKTMGQLTAVAIDTAASKEKKRTHYLCQCTCGRTKSVPRKDFLAGKVITCGNVVHQYEKARDKYLGKHAGCYQIIAQNVMQPHIYECRCTLCGFTGILSRASLNAYMRGDVCSGCTNCAYDVGHHYGKLTIVGKDTEMSTLKCRCCCGNEVAFSLDDFKARKPRSCGHCRTKLPPKPINGEQSALVVQYHDRINKFMGRYRLDEREWYDYLSLTLIRSAVEYTTRPPMDIPFPAMLWVRFRQDYATAIKRMHQGNGKLRSEAISLDAPAGDNADKPLAGCLPDGTCMEDNCVANMSVQGYLSYLEPLERHVATLISEGYIYRDTGAILGLTEPQVQSVVKNIRDKLAPIVYAG